MALNEIAHAARLYATISAEVAGATDHCFVDRSFWRTWHEGADAALFASYVAALATGRLSRLGVVRLLAADPRHGAALAGRRPLGLIESLHMARCRMVRGLPPAAHIVDIGGAAPASEQGALLVMGYRHLFRSLTIVDLPPDLRFGRYARGAVELDAGRIETTLGPVRYVHGSMTDLSALPDGSADLVFSGQSIEHVTPEEGRRVLREVRRVLRRGGSFFLDTPNAALTRLQSPGAFIHPEHKVEYRVGELIELLQAEGFQVRRSGGIAPMPRSLRAGTFDAGEAIAGARLSRHAEEAYLFFVEARS